MPEPIEDFAYAVGDAIVSPGLGSAELVVALLVAAAFIASALQTFLSRHKRESGFNGRRS